SHGHGMTTALFRFAEALAPFLAPAHRGRQVAYACARAANLKNAIEALGVPHTEIGAVTVNGSAATLQRTVREGDDIEVSACTAVDRKSVVEGKRGGRGGRRNEAER